MSEPTWDVYSSAIHVSGTEECLGHLALWDSEPRIPGKLIKTDFWALPTPEFLSRCGSEPDIYISNTFPGDAEAGT